MRIFGLLLLGTASVAAGIYLMGCYLLRQPPWSFWREAQPDMYDGKEPYAEWAAKMHLARATQMKEESE